MAIIGLLLFCISRPRVTFLHGFFVSMHMPIWPLIYPPGRLVIVYLFPMHASCTTRLQLSRHDVAPDKPHACGRHSICRIAPTSFPGFTLQHDSPRSCCICMNGAPMLPQLPGQLLQTATSNSHYCPQAHPTLSPIFSSLGALLLQLEPVHQSPIQLHLHHAKDVT